MKRKLILLIALLCAFLLCACSLLPTVEPSSEEPSVSSPAPEVSNFAEPSVSSSVVPDAPSATSAPKATATPAPANLTMKVLAKPASVNPLTGLDAAGSDPSVRPVAVMINNIKRALPQYGLKSADIIYEIPAEGGITRLLALYLDPSKVNVIGSVRSSRPIFINVASSYDAIYFHHGGSPEAYEMLKAGAVTNVDAMSIGGVFYRDEWRRKNLGYEHSSMTTGAKVAARLATMKKNGTRMTSNQSGNVFNFVYSDFTPAGGNAAKITVRTGNYYSYYDYNPSYGSYTRTQNDYTYDANGTGKLDVRNVFVLEMDYAVIDGDNKGRLSFENFGSGDGFYFTNGKMMKIKWSWPSAKDHMRFYDAEGAELTVNAGKSFIHFVASLANTKAS